MSIRPLHDRILIKRLGEEGKTKGEIVIADAAKEKPMQGKVLAVGKGKVNDMGKAKTVKVDKDNTIIVGGNGSVVERLKREDGSFGFNAETETYEDLMKAGIVDPTKVTRLALQNASSIAGLLLTTDVVVTEKPKKKNSAKMP